MESKAVRAGSARRPPWIRRNLFDPLTVLLVGRLGRERIEFQAVELTGADKLPVFRAHLRRCGRWSGQ